MTKLFGVVLILAGCVVVAQNTTPNQSPPKADTDVASCLIVKHASTSRQVFVSGANWQYVAGKFPKGMK